MLLTIFFSAKVAILIDTLSGGLIARPEIRNAFKFFIFNQETISNRPSRRAQSGFEGLEVGAEGGAGFGIFETELDVGFEEAEFVAGVVGFAVVDVAEHAFFASQSAKAVSELDFA